MKTTLTIFFLLLTLAFLVMAGCADITGIAFTYFLLAVCGLMCTFYIYFKMEVR
jgi:hypothetical protein